MRRLYVTEFSNEDLLWLLEAVKSAQDYLEPKAVLRDIADWKIQAWRLEEGLMLTELHPKKEGKILFIFALAGRRLAFNGKMLKNQLMRAASSLGCSEVQGLVKDQRILKKILQHGGKELMTLFSLEVPSGQQNQIPEQYYK